MSETGNTGWTWDAEQTAWAAPIENGARTVLWLSGPDSPPSLSPAQVLARTNVNGRTRT